MTSSLAVSSASFESQKENWKLSSRDRGEGGEESRNLKKRIERLPVSRLWSSLSGSAESQKENWKIVRKPPSLAISRYPNLKKRIERTIIADSHLVFTRQNLKKRIESERAPVGLGMDGRGLEWISKRELKVREPFSEPLERVFKNLKKRIERGPGHPHPHGLTPENLKKRIESISTATLSRINAVSESQKENWKYIHRIIHGLVPESQKENWKYSFFSYNRPGRSIGESQKENWKSTKLTRSMHSSNRWISKRELKVHAVEHKPIIAYAVESQKENWKLMRRSRN